MASNRGQYDSQDNRNPSRVDPNQGSHQRRVQVLQSIRPPPPSTWRQNQQPPYRNYRSRCKMVVRRSGSSGSIERFAMKSLGLQGKIIKTTAYGPGVIQECRYLEDG